MKKTHREAKDIKLANGERARQATKAHKYQLLK